MNDILDANSHHKNQDYTNINRTAHQHIRHHLFSASGICIAGRYQARKTRWIVFTSITLSMSCESGEEGWLKPWATHFKPGLQIWLVVLVIRLIGFLVFILKPTPACGTWVNVFLSSLPVPPRKPVEWQRYWPKRLEFPNAPCMSFLKTNHRTPKIKLPSIKSVLSRFQIWPIASSLQDGGPS